MKQIKNLIEKNLLKYEQIKESILNNEFASDLLEENITYLNSDEAFESIDLDPYWPKWHTPWWRITIMYEMDLIHLVPQKIIEKMLEKIQSYYIDFFPLVEEEIPEGIDPTRNIICHCQLGTIVKILNSLDYDFSNKFQWMKEWFIKYQITDGGLNCDESVYTKTNPKSSVVSSLPAFEAVLGFSNRSKEENEFLDKGANYLIKRKIFRRSDNGEVIDKNWLEPFFPRFYEFDILRGLYFLTEWAKTCNRGLPIEAIKDSLEILDAKINNDGFLTKGESSYLNITTIFPDKNNSYARKKAELFPLLNELNKPSDSNKYLSREWYKTIENLNLLYDKNLLI